MYLFNIEKYELPTTEQVNWEATKYQVGIFLSVYKRNRERVGLPSIPNLSIDNIYLIDAKHIEEQHNKQLFDIHSEQFEAFTQTQNYFIQGLSAINHPYQPNITERRRKIFFFRFLYGLSIPIISDRINYQKNIIITESKVSMMQFASALDLLVLKNQQSSD